VIRVIAIAAILPAVLAGCGSTAPTAAPATVTVAAPAPAAVAPTASAEPKMVTLPEVKGRNGGIVADELRELGLTKVDFASRDKADKVVVLPQNWTVVKIEPAAGTEVRSNQTVVVTMTKN
jgi:hypothetical protein